MAKERGAAKRHRRSLSRSSARSPLIFRLCLLTDRREGIESRDGGCVRHGLEVSIDAKHERWYDTRERIQVLREASELHIDDAQPLATAM